MPSTDHYYYVSMGPILVKDGKPTPGWHRELTESSYPFPTLEAATRFALTHKQLDPERAITIDYPDGRRWDGRRFV